MTWKTRRIWTLQSFFSASKMCLSINFKESIQSDELVVYNIDLCQRYFTEWAPVSIWCDFVKKLNIQKIQTFVDSILRM